MCLRSKSIGYTIYRLGNKCIKIHRYIVIKLLKSKWPLCSIYLYSYISLLYHLQNVFSLFFAFNKHLAHRSNIVYSSKNAYLLYIVDLQRHSLRNPKRLSAVHPPRWANFRINVPWDPEAVTFAAALSSPRPRSWLPLTA